MTDIIEEVPQPVDELQEISNALSERMRDDKGRFAKDEPEPQPEPEPNPQPEPEAYTPKLNGYTKEQREALTQLTPDVLKIIDQREESFHRGLDPYREKAQFADNIRTLLNSDIQLLQQNNIQPEQFIGNLVSVERQLRNGDPLTKIRVLQGLAHDYGIDPSVFQQVPFDPYQHQLLQQNRALEQRLQTTQVSTQTAEVEQLNNLINEFAQSHEYFEELKPTIADLLDKGLASDLEDAYAKATRLNDDVFSKLHAKQPTTEQVQAVKANQVAKAAKAAAVSVKGGSPSGRTTQATPANTRDAVALAMEQHGL